MADTHVFVCQNADCQARGSSELLRLLRERLEQSAGADVRPYMCFGVCQAGPNIVVYPQKVFYSGVKTSDLEAIAAHVEGGPPVDRLMGGVDDASQGLIFQLLDAGLF